VICGVRICLRVVIIDKQVRCGTCYSMGQAVTVANASGDKLYVKVQSTVELSEKTDFTVSGSTPSTSAGGSATGKLDVEVTVFFSDYV